MTAGAAFSRGPVAIIGIGCRFPGADGPDAFWDLLVRGRDAVTEIPPERMDLDGLYDPQPGRPGRMSTRWAGLIDGIDRFDAGFFGIAPREAAGMDPQQRLILEVAWEALEDAGLPRERLAGSRTGVFVGISSFDYGSLPATGLDGVDAWSGTGHSHSIAAGRLSYCLDLRGPCLAVDTACSSSLVALHLARQALAAGECDTAIVCGVNAVLSPGPMIAFSAARMMAADGRCKVFDERADGYVRGEGCGVVVLRPLDRALAEGDPVVAVLHGTAMNQDGRSNGLTAPNGPAQEEVIRLALADAGLSPQDVGVVEAHGTGTSLGDPIEVLALASVLPGPCLIGSVKSNIGHLEAAAGIAGIIKAALAARHGVVPPSLHYTRPNPEIPFERIGLRVAAAAEPWPAGKLCGVSGFGFGGTNAHALIGPPPAKSGGDHPAGDHVLELLLAVSAHTHEALVRRASDLAERLDGGADPVDLAFTLARRRSHLDYRLAVVGGDAAALADGLRRAARGETGPGIALGRRLPNPRPVLAVFGPSVELDAAAIRRLADGEPAFGRCLDELGAAAETLAALEPGERTLADTVRLQLALAAVWRGRGIRVKRALGLGVGALTASAVLGRMPAMDAVSAAGEAAAVSDDGIAALVAALDADGVALRLPVGIGGALAATLGLSSAGPSRGEELAVLAELYVHGHVPDFDAILPAGRPVPLPRYPWQRSIHWFDPAAAPSARAVRRVVLSLSTESTPGLAEHRIDGRIVVPLATGLLLAADALDCRGVKNVRVLRMLELPEAADGAPGHLELTASARGGHCRITAPGGAVWMEAETDPGFGPETPAEEDGGSSLERPVAGAGRAAGLTAALSLFRDLAPPGSGVFLPTGVGQVWLASPDADGGASTGEGTARAVLHDGPTAVPESPGRAPGRASGSLRLWDAGGAPLARLDGIRFQARRQPAELPAAELPAAFDPGPALERERARLLAEAPDSGAEELAEALAAVAALYARRAVDALAPEGGAGAVVPRHRRLFARLEVIGRDADPAADPEALVQAAAARWPGRAGEIALVADCGRTLPEILTGRRNPLEILFPGGDSSRLAAIYRDSPAMRIGNRLTALAVTEILQAEAAAGPLSIVEIGAGTGGTTTHVVEALTAADAGAVSYLFTDVSPPFLEQAAAAPWAPRWLSTRLFDAERSPAEQGMPCGEAGIVIAANVLHATADLARTLANAAALLKPGGRLVLVELTAQRPWLDLVFGLTDGWWRFTDAPLRRNGPLLASEEWAALLRRSGFADVGSHACDAGQAVIVARYTGAAAPVRQPVTGAAVAWSAAGPAAVRRQLDDLVRRILRLPPDVPLDPDCALQDMGLDSLTGLELRDALQHATGLDLPATVVLEHPSIAALAAYLHAAGASAAPTRSAPRITAPRSAEPGGPGAVPAIAGGGLKGLLADMAHMDDAAAWRLLSGATV